MSTQDQLEQNLLKFEELSESIGAENAGRTALLHDGELVEIYDESNSAYFVGVEKFGLGKFSIETFGRKPKSMGFLATYGIMASA